MESSTEKFLDLIDENKKLIYKISHLYCDQVIDMNDLFQEIIENLWKAFPSFRGEAKVSTWIYRIAINTAVSWYRDYVKKSNHIVYTGIVPTLEENHGMNELYEQLHNAISHLGNIDKAIILLQLDGYSYDEISEIIGISKTNVATKINRIKMKLKNHLSNN